MNPRSGFSTTFVEGQLSLGLYFPIETYTLFPTMERQTELAVRAEALGFRALWVRDIPLFDPGFQEVGQIYDPWVYLGFIASQTTKIALGTGSIVLPIRHPLHVAKAAASIDGLSSGRFIMGVGAGDRHLEYDAVGLQGDVGERFRDGFSYVREATEKDYPIIHSSLGRMRGTNLIPKPFNGKLPIMVTGHSRQTVDWIAEHADGWLNYPRDAAYQKTMIKNWQTAVETVCPGQFKPFSQPLRLDLTSDPNADRLPIPLGYRLGRHALIEHLSLLQSIGVNHVIFVLKDSKRPAADVIEELGEYVLPKFDSRGRISREKRD